ncbi:MAG: PKD domain-containing protein [Flavobacteriales bacterium]|nr:PKD domain-containing protein [Flavobacteriales bacterium]
MVKKLLLVLFVLVSGMSYAVTNNSGFGYFQITYASDCAPVNVSFTNFGYPGATNYKWYFGDGSPVNTTMSPSHTFANAGVYTVQVEYYGPSGNFLANDYYYLYLNGDPNGINTYANQGCVGDRMVFFLNFGDPNSIYNVYTYTYNYGDGNVETHPYSSSEHTYNSPGTYNVSITVNTPCGTFIENTTITIGTNVPMTTGWFDMWPNNICPGDMAYVNYGGSSTQFITFGDGTFGTDPYNHTYNTPGVYPVTATLTNGCGNSQTFYDTVYVSNNIQFDPYSPINFWHDNAACPGMTVNFQASAQYSSVLWQFPDGTTSSQFELDKLINQSFANHSIYLTVTNGCGFDTTVQSQINIVSTMPVTDIDLFAPPTVCTGGEFLFTADGNDSPPDNVTYTWDFGDGTTTNDYSGTHIFANSGTYTITLTAVNACGSDSTQTMTVTAGNNVAPDPNYTQIMVAPEDGACVGDSVLIVVYPGLEGDYFFDFGDGTNSNSYSFLNVFGREYAYTKHRYNASGTYTVTVTYTNSCGLSVTKSLDYNIGSSIPASAEVLYDPSQNVCFGDPVSFSAFGGTSYEWNFGDNTGTLVTTNTFIPVEHTYAVPGPYNVTVRVTNACGNTDIATVNVVVPDNRINLTTSSVDAQCGQESGKAIAVISGGNPPYSVTWSNGDTGVLIDSLASGIYVANVTDSKGCYNFALATVSDAQAPAIVVSNVVDVTCYGASNGVIDIHVIGSTGPFTYQWSNGANSEDISNLAAGPYEITVTDAYGCKAVESIEVGSPGEVTVSFITQSADCGANNGMIQAVANGNSGPFTYVWSTGTLDDELFNLGAGIYTVNVIDQNGCLVTESVALSEVDTTAGQSFGGPAILTSSISDLDCNGPGSTIDIEIVQSSGNLSYNWSTGATTQDVTVSSVGDYSVMVTDNTTGCKAYELFTISHAAPNGQEICMVTVDSMYSFNKVVWEKEITTQISHYNVYRESSQNGLYYLIGTVPYDSLSLYNDYVANPMITAWRYKVAAVDYCGEESSWSALHKTIHVNQNLGLGGVVNLIWDHYKGFDYTTYTIIRYTDANGWQTIGSVSSANTSFTDPTPPSDPSLFYVIETNPTVGCVSTRAINNNSTRSNRTQNSVMSPAASVGEILGSIEGMAIFPNPNDGQFTLQADFVSADQATIELYSMDGRVISAWQINAGQGRYSRSIDMSSEPAGIYFVRISNGTSSFVKKVIIR